MFVYKIQVNPIHTILKYGDYYDFMDRLWCSSKRFQSMAIKRILKINNSCPELFNFQIPFDYDSLELLRTAPLPIHKVIIIAIF